MFFYIITCMKKKETADLTNIEHLQHLNTLHSYASHFFAFILEDLALLLVLKNKLPNGLLENDEPVINQEEYENIQEDIIIKSCQLADMDDSDFFKEIKPLNKYLSNKIIEEINFAFINLKTIDSIFLDLYSIFFDKEDLYKSLCESIYTSILLDLFLSGSICDILNYGFDSYLIEGKDLNFTGFLLFTHDTKINMNEISKLLSGYKVFKDDDNLRSFFDFDYHEFKLEIIDRFKKYKGV